MRKCTTCRYEQGAAILDDTLYVIGGHYAGRYLGDVWSLDLRSPAWQPVKLACADDDCAPPVQAESAMQAGRAAAGAAATDGLAPNGAAGGAAGCVSGGGSGAVAAPSAGAGTAPFSEASSTSPGMMSPAAAAAAANGAMAGGFPLCAGHAVVPWLGKLLVVGGHSKVQAPFLRVF